MYQEKDTPPQTGIFLLVTPAMLEEYKKQQEQQMTKLDRLMIVLMIVFVLAIITTKQWS